MLDSRYEITSERALSPSVTLFTATAPDGTALYIHWYELQSSDDEDAFERYRRLLRRLDKRGYAAIYDLVSRPGAHYVAWRVPGDRGAHTVSLAPPDLPKLAALFEGEPWTLDDAYICAQPASSPQLYGLSFDGAGYHQPSVQPAWSASGADDVGSAFSPRGALGDARTPPRRPRGGHPDASRTEGTLPRPLLLGALLFLTGVLLLLWSVQRGLQTSLVRVPDVRGQDVSAALDALYRAGFATHATPLLSDAPLGTVLELRPEPGTALRPGRTVDVQYARTAQSASERAPVVTGLSVSAARQSLVGAGLELGALLHIPSPEAVGTVLAQHPAAEIPIALGHPVDLLVSAGAGSALSFLPDLTGLTLSDARKLAEAAGFAPEAVQTDRVQQVSAAPETVLSQNIAPFRAVDPQRARLRLTVAEAQTQNTSVSGTPDLIGLTLGAAQLRARAAGAGVTVTHEVSTRQLPSGVVLQQPAPGEAFSEQIGVTLNVYDAPLPRPTVTAEVMEVADTTATDRGTRRVRYAWQLDETAAGKRATITVTFEDGSSLPVVANRQVAANERLEGSYLSTEGGELVFTLRLDGEPYGAPFRASP